ncbi:MAG: transposase [Candidatus Zambryskibacteria bacterium]|nr:transposase [Candidatus Zambryskibacteria bacterium]
MSIRKVPFIQDEYYHVYSRGNDKRKIFHDHTDYNRFQKLLYLANSDKNFRLETIKNVYEIERGDRLVFIGAYCPMPNHLHILIKQNSENGISKFMQKFLTGYSMYYNIKYERTGSLFEGKFKVEHLGNDGYLKYVFSYIHLNPVKLIYPDWKESGLGDKKRVLSFLSKYTYSSFLDYIMINRPENAILDRNEFPDYFPSKKHFENEILDWISYRD